MKVAAKFLGVAALVIVLTLVTQIGGVVLLVAWALTQPLKAVPRVLRYGLVIVLFAVLHVAATSYLVPPLAKLAGREPLACEPGVDRAYGALSPIYCYLGRNYVRSEVRGMLDALAHDMAATHPGTVVAYLDAGFPFLDGFPLIPHLSHRDGRRIDLAYFYTFGGRYVPRITPSPIGYWGFEKPRGDEIDECRDKPRWLTLRWDMAWFELFFIRKLRLDEERTAAMLRWLAEKGPEHGVDRILIEPHMARRLGVESPIIRFQGCRAARHDDHIHVEVRKAQRQD